jgi:regulatory protein
VVPRSRGHSTGNAGRPPRGLRGNAAGTAAGALRPEHSGTGPGAGPADGAGITAEAAAGAQCPGDPGNAAVPGRAVRPENAAAAEGAQAPGAARNAKDAERAEAAARQICLRLLTVAPRTRAQLADALGRRGVPGDVADAVLGRFAEAHLIDDAAFAKAWVESRHHGRGLSRRALAAELRQRGVADDDLRDAVGMLGPDQEATTARRLVDKKLAATRGLPPPARIRRLMGVLARKGYPPGLAYRVVREALEQEGADLAAYDETDPAAELSMFDADVNLVPFACLKRYLRLTSRQRGVTPHGADGQRNNQRQVSMTGKPGPQAAGRAGRRRSTLRPAGRWGRRSAVPLASGHNPGIALCDPGARRVGARKG